MRAKRMQRSGQHDQKHALSFQVITCSLSGTRVWARTSSRTDCSGSCNVNECGAEAVPDWHIL